MSILTHVRFRIWDGQRYTKAQASEMRQLHEIYATHLARYQLIEETALALREEGEGFFYPALQQARVTPRGVEQGVNGLVGGRLLPFAVSLINSVDVFSARRDQRWYKKGHDNDPTRLFCAYLRDFFQQRLVAAHCTQETLAQLEAMQHFLSVLRMQEVFKQEPENHESMTLLLHNLDRKLDESIETVAHYLDLHAAREAFDLLQRQARGVLDDAVQFLFYSVSDRDKQHVDFSLLSYYTTTDERLEKVLNTRAGQLLKHVVAGKVMQSIVKPGERASQPVTLALGLPIVLLNGPAEEMAFLDETGQVHAGLIDLLAGKRKGVSKAARLLEADVVEQVKKDPALLETFIHLHSFIEVFAEYAALVEDFWKLAGFGGDQFIYHQLADVVQTLMREFQDFNQSFADALKRFSQQLSAHFNQSVAQGKSKQWQRNYQQGQQFSQQVLEKLAQSQVSLRHIIQKTSNTPEKYRHHQKMQVAYEHVQNAQALIQKARLQAGREAFNGAAWTQRLPALPSLDGDLSPWHEDREPPQLPGTIQHILKPLIGSKHDHIDFLEGYQLDVIEPPGLSCWVGSWTRYRYFHDIERFRPLFEGMRLVQEHPCAQLEETEAALAQVQRARASIRAEFARIVASRQRLWWPFQRKSITFLGLWQEIFIGIESELDALEAKVQKAHQAHVQAQALGKALLDLTPLFARHNASLNLSMALQGKSIIFDRYQDPLSQQKIRTAARAYITHIPTQGLSSAGQELVIQQVIQGIDDQEITDAYYTARVLYLLNTAGLAGLVSNQKLLEAIADHNNPHLIDQLSAKIQESIKSSTLPEVSEFYIALQSFNIRAFKACVRSCKTRLQSVSAGIPIAGVQGAFFPRPKEPSESYCAVSQEKCDEYLAAQRALAEQLLQYCQR